MFEVQVNEAGCVTSRDMILVGVGFRRALGDQTFSPLTYALRACFIRLKPIEVNFSTIVIILGGMILGYYIFHSSNYEKSKFRQGKLPHLSSIQTSRGTKLLCDSWWSVSQHINYFGDWLMSLSWCLTTWFNTPLTYFYSIYFMFLLLHRQQRMRRSVVRNMVKIGKSTKEEYLTRLYHMYIKVLMYTIQAIFTLVNVLNKFLINLSDIQAMTFSILE